MCGYLCKQGPCIHSGMGDFAVINTSREVWNKQASEMNRKKEVQARIDNKCEEREKKKNKSLKPKKYIDIKIRQEKMK